MDPNSIPKDFPWREAIAAMPPWARQMIATAAGVDEKVFGGGGNDDRTSTTTESDEDPPGRGRPSDRKGEHGHEGHGRGGQGWDMPGWPLPGGFGPSGFGPGFMRALMGGGRGQWPGGRPRASRGDVRSAILSLLTEEPMHGYQLLQEMTKRSGGAWSPSPGSVYPTLSQLEDEGLVKGKKDGGRRIFTLTDDGRAAAEANGDDAPWDSVGDRFADQADDGVMGLREEIASTAAAVMAVATSGSDEHIARAKSMLASTRKDLYRLLAED